jgi:hypothetical protein
VAAINKWRRKTQGASGSFSIFGSFRRSFSQSGESEVSPILPHSYPTPSTSTVDILILSLSLCGPLRLLHGEHKLAMLTITHTTSRQSRQTDLFLTELKPIYVYLPYEGRSHLKKRPQAKRAQISERRFSMETSQ